MKVTGTVGNSPRFDDEFRQEKQTKREYRKQQKSFRDLRRGRNSVWSERSEK